MHHNGTSENPFFFVFCVFLLLVYWLKHIFGSITNEASIKSIIALFYFFLQIIFEKILMDLSVLPLGIIMLLCFIYGHYFQLTLHWIWKWEISLDTTFQCLSFSLWSDLKKKTLLINVCESLATQCISSNMDISLLSIGADQPNKPDLLIKFLPNDWIKPS